MAETPPPKPRIVDDPDVHEVYANKFISAGFDGGAVAVTLGCMRFLPERVDTPLRQGQQPDVHVTARLAISPAVAVELINGLNNILANLAQKAGSGIAAQAVAAPKATKS
jgi:hypothetical protein